MKTQARIDTNKINLPGFMGTPIAAALDADLRQHLADELEAVRGLLAEVELAPDENGMPPEGFERHFNPRASNNLTVLERNAHRVRAIQQELAEREQAAAEQRETKRADAKRSLQQIVDDGPAEAAQLTQHVTDAAPAVARIRQFVQDVHTLAVEKARMNRLNSVHEGVREAADTLGVTQPAMPELPEGAPTQEDMEAVLYLLRGAHGGFDNDDVGKPGDYGRTGKLANQLRNPT